MLNLRVEFPKAVLVHGKGAEQLAVDVVLGLGPGPVADPHRARVPPATQVGKHPLGEVALTPDPVHDLDRLAVHVAAGGAGHEGEEVLRLVRAGADVERLQGEARVADP